MNNNKTRGISGLSILLCVLVLAGVYWFMSSRVCSRQHTRIRISERSEKREGRKCRGQAEQSRTDWDTEDPAEE